MKTMKTISFVLFLMTIFISSIAQKDPEAKKILDKVSAKNNKYETIKVKFEYQVKSLQQKSEEAYKGMIFIKNDKYKLFLMGNQIYFNGTDMAVYSPEMQEVTISDVDTADRSSLNPADLFTMYNEGFKYRLLEHTDEDKSEAIDKYIIDLVPEKPAEKSYSRIILIIDKQDMQISSMKYYGKNGSRYRVDITDVETNVTIPDSMFSFDAGKFPDVDVIDLRQ